MQRAVKVRLSALTKLERILRILTIIICPVLFVAILYNLGDVITYRPKGWIVYLVFFAMYGSILPYYAQKWVFSWIRKAKGARSYDADIEIVADEVSAIESEKAKEEYEKELKRLASLSESSFRYEVISLIKRADNTTRQQAKQLGYVMVFVFLFFCAILKNW